MRLPVFILSFWTEFTGWLERNQLVCPSKRFFHIDCPGCGFQRSFLLLLKGDVAASLAMYPALLPVLLLWLYLVLHLKYRFRNGARNLVVLFIGCCTIITGHYIYKVLQLQVF
jgi:hypothetical protein